MRHLQAFPASLLMTLTYACADDPSKPSDQLQIYETCLETVCDQMSQSGNSACSACESACFAASYDCDPSTACSDSCSARDCSDADRNTCVEQGYKVTPPNNPSADVLNACEQVIAQVSSCGSNPAMTDADCQRYAGVDLAADAAVFTCIAQLDCGSLNDSTALAGCVPAAMTSTFGDDLCAQWVAACPSDGCSSDMQSSLDSDGAWLRDDALAAAGTCLAQPSCGETATCLSAWRSAVE